MELSGKLAKELQSGTNTNSCVGGGLLRSCLTTTWKPQSKQGDVSDLAVHPSVTLLVSCSGAIVCLPDTQPARKSAGVSDLNLEVGDLPN